MVGKMVKHDLRKRLLVHADMYNRARTLRVPSRGYHHVSSVFVPSLFGNVVSAFRDKAVYYLINIVEQYIDFSSMILVYVGMQAWPPRVALIYRCYIQYNLDISNLDKQKLYISNWTPWQN
jgi:hypothetical protein